MQKTLQTNDLESNVKQQIDQCNFQTIIRSQQPLECFVQLFTE